jgi:hypothetical protein
MKDKSKKAVSDSRILKQLAKVSAQIKKQQENILDSHRRLAIMLLAIIDGGGGGGSSAQERLTDFFIDLLERQNEIAEEGTDKKEKPTKRKPSAGNGNTTPINPDRPCAEMLEALRNAVSSGNLQLIANTSKNYQNCLRRKRLNKADK